MYNPKQIDPPIVYFEEPEPIYCPECGMEVEYLYMVGNEIIGCDKCIERVDPYNEDYTGVIYDD